MAVYGYLQAHGALRARCALDNRHRARPGVAPFSGRHLVTLEILEDGWPWRSGNQEWRDGGLVAP
jgi:hypothetical protein